MRMIEKYESKTADDTLNGLLGKSELIIGIEDLIIVKY